MIKYRFTGPDMDGGEIFKSRPEDRLHVNTMGGIEIPLSLYLPRHLPVQMSLESIQALVEKAVEKMVAELNESL